jgi:hypothetical protein
MRDEQLSKSSSDASDSGEADPTDPFTLAAEADKQTA